MKKIPGKVLQTRPWGLSLFPILTPPTPTPPKTKHTCELAALVQDQVGERHALENLNVAWGNGVGGGRVGRNEEGFWEGSLGEVLGPQSVEPHSLPVLSTPTHL